MNRLLVLGLPIAKSVLYDRRSMLKGKFFKRNNHTISSIIRPRENLTTIQRDGIPCGRVSYTTPVSHETVSTCSVRHQATRRRVLYFREWNMAEKQSHSVMARCIRCFRWDDATNWQGTSSAFTFHWSLEFYKLDTKDGYPTYSASRLHLEK